MVWLGGNTFRLVEAALHELGVKVASIGDVHGGVGSLAGGERYGRGRAVDSGGGLPQLLAAGVDQ